MKFVRNLLLFVIVAYGAAAAIMFLRQRDLMYHPETIQVSPAEAKLPQAEAFDLVTPDGQTIKAWWVAPQRDNAPVFLYFHGNAGNLADRAKRFGLMTQDGSGLLAIDWRGFGGSTGSPTEQGLYADATTAYAWALTKVPADRIVIFGESLGTSLAVRLAAEKPAAALILDSPFTSAMEMASSQYWWLPVKFLMQDTYRSDEWIKKVTVPLLVLHGDADPIVPFTYGQRLFEMANEPKVFHRFPGGEHIVSYKRDGADVVRNFVSTYVK